MYVFGIKRLERSRQVVLDACVPSSTTCGYSIQAACWTHQEGECAPRRAHTFGLPVAFLGARLKLKSELKNTILHFRNTRLYIIFGSNMLCDLRFMLRFFAYFCNFFFFHGADLAKILANQKSFKL